MVEALREIANSEDRPLWSLKATLSPEGIVVLLVTGGSEGMVFAKAIELLGGEDALSKIRA